MAIEPGSARFGSAVSTHPDPALAVAEVVGEVADRIGPGPDLAVVFVSGPLIAAVDDILAVVRAALRPATLLAVSSAGVVGNWQEIDRGGAISLWAGHTGAVTPLRLQALPGTPPVLVGLEEVPPAGSTLLLLADPFSMPVDAVFDAVGPHVAVVGGLASAARAPGGNVLVLDDERHSDGGVAVVIPPGVAEPLVSQGCRPIGEPWVVTRCDGQRLFELAGRPASERLRELIDSLSPGDRALAGHGLHLGVVARERADDFRRGDFLIRGVMGLERESGAVVVGDRLELGQVVQFQVRDAGSARDDLSAALVDRQQDSSIDATLLFTCTGRGPHMFGDGPNDASLIAELTSDAPMAGMFCAGEIGPVGPRNAMHGFTATMCTFRDGA